MANKLILDRTYSYAGKHYGPGVVVFGDDEQGQEAMDAVAKRHMEVLADARKRKLPPPSPIITEEQLYSQPDEDQLSSQPEEHTFNRSQVYETRAAGPRVRDMIMLPEASPADTSEVEDPALGDTGARSGEAEDDMRKKTARELASMAEERGISVDGLRTKSELVRALTE